MLGFSADVRHRCVGEQVERVLSDRLATRVGKRENRLAVLATLWQCNAQAKGSNEYMYEQGKERRCTGRQLCFCLLLITALCHGDATGLFHRPPL